MKLNFQQGIITYPSSGSIQTFLVKTGNYVSLSTSNGRIDVTLSHGITNYLLTESTDQPNAWGPIPANTDVWLYWDISLLTGVRTFGHTLLQPSYGTSFPLSPATDQHFFNTTDKKMYVYENNAWREVIRLFAAKVNNSTFSPLGVGFPLKPYAGSQVGLNGVPTTAGRILIDDTGNPIRRQDNRFFTTEDDIFTNGSPVNTIRLEANVLTATALENLSAYQAVRFSEFGKINIATYDDLQTHAIAMLMETVGIGEVGTVIMQGTVTNPDWSFTTVGAKLWVDNSGVIVEVDPHISDPLNYPVGKPAIGRVITPNTIFFDQGLGGVGDRGLPGPAGVVDVATNSIVGVAKLSVAAVDPTNPIVVGDNDPRIEGDRNPLPHNQAATTITFTSYGNLTAANVQLVLQQVEDNKLSRSGGTMTGALTLAGSPSNNLHAATKQYVDSMTLASLGGVSLISPSDTDVLTYISGQWTNRPRFVVQPVAYAPTLIIDASDGADEYRTTLSGNVTLGFTGGYDGQRFAIKLKQDGVGNRTIAFDSSVRVPTDIDILTFSTAPNSVDRLGFTYDADDDVYDLIAIVAGYA